MTTYPPLVPAAGTISLPMTWESPRLTQLTDDERRKLYWRRKADRERQQPASQWSSGVLAKATHGINVVSAWYRWPCPTPFLAFAAPTP